MFWVFVAVFWIAMIVSPVALLIAFLPPGRDCPRCGGETLSIRRAFLRPVYRLLHQRWCMACGWEGMMRQTGRPAPVQLQEAFSETAHEADDEAWRGGKD